MFRKDHQDVEVLNAGIGNYNTSRYVKLFFKRLQDLEPSDIVVHYFLRDAEPLDPGGGNFLLRNSQLAVAGWVLFHRYFGGAREGSLEEHYEKVYSPGAEGFEAMKRSLKQLSDYAREKKIRIYLALVPDVHNLAHYPFRAIHERVKSIALEDGYRFVDLLPGFEGLNPGQVWAMPGDPHLNALGHEIMAGEIYPTLKL
jgi:hypothetical protein